MALTLRSGPMTWSGERDDEGHRTYTIVHLVESTDRFDGPAVIMNCPGLPTAGATWDVGNDEDVFATVTPYMRVRFHQEQQGNNTTWEVEQRATTKPLKRCQDTSIEDPLDEPPKISVVFGRDKREVAYNEDGTPILNSSYERIKGSEVEFDHGKPTVKISMNFATIDLDLFAEFSDPPHLNDSTLWGCAARTVKVSSIEVERKYYGVCSVYYTVTYEFEINKLTWDRDLLDEGYRVMAPGTVASLTPNPRNWIVYKDKKGENAQCVLDGYGSIWHGGVSGSLVSTSADGGVVTFSDSKHGITKNDTLKLTWNSGANVRHGLTVTEHPVGGDAAKIRVSLGAGDSFPFPGTTAVSTGNPGSIHVAHYPEANLLLLGIPSSIF